jgi:hypothetical protein
MPYPIGRVLARHDLGRFRVIQKANLDDPDDVYRIENADPADWIMLGNHDTPPISALAPQWCSDGRGQQWGRYLASLLVCSSDQASYAAKCAAEPQEMVHAVFAAMLASRSRNVMVFFPDLFGIDRRYNEPGFVNESNWSLLLPADFAGLYRERIRHGLALDLGRSFSMALRARENQMRGAMAGLRRTL